MKPARHDRPERPGAGLPGDSRAPLPRVRKPATVRCLGPVDARALAARAARLSARAWSLRDSGKENNSACFHHTRHIVFRFIESNRDPRRFYSWPGWRLWRALLLPVMERATASYRFREPVYPKAMLARLEAGQRIDLHLDVESDGLPDSHPFVHKIHVPLDTNPAAVVTVAGATVHLPAGSAWEINNLALHGASNGGARDRIHFIFEVFDGAGQQVTEEIRKLGVVRLPAGGEPVSGPPAARSRSGRAGPGGPGTPG